MKLFRGIFWGMGFQRVNLFIFVVKHQGQFYERI